MLILGALSHVSVIDTSGDVEAVAKKPTAWSIGAGFPPVPLKLIERIQAGDFIDMAELLPERLGFNAFNCPMSDDKDGKHSSKSRKRQVTTITEWVQCFSIYAAVIAEKYPIKIRDLLGYQALLVEAHIQYEGDAWLGYDRRFRQTAAASPDLVWAHIEPTLWNMAFAGHAKSARCKHCFSLSHQSHDCDWAPSDNVEQAQLPPRPSHGKQSQAKLCYSWNNTPTAACIFPNCKYAHLCLHCVNDPKILDKQHKAMFCPRRHQPSFGSGKSHPFTSQPAARNRYRPY